MKRFIFVIMICLLTGCAVVTTDRITTADSQGKFHVGMTYDEVVSIVGRGPISSDIYKETVTTGVLKRFWKVYGKCDSWDPVGMYRFYTFEFVNDKLTSWSWNK